MRVGKLSLEARFRFQQSAQNEEGQLITQASSTTLATELSLETDPDLSERANDISAPPHTPAPLTVDHATEARA